MLTKHVEGSHFYTTFNTQRSLTKVSVTVVLDNTIAVFVKRSTVVPRTSSNIWKPQIPQTLNIINKVPKETYFYYKILILTHNHISLYLYVPARVHLGL